MWGQISDCDTTKQAFVALSREVIACATTKWFSSDNHHSIKTISKKQQQKFRTKSMQHKIDRTYYDRQFERTNNATVFRVKVWIVTVSSRRSEWLIGMRGYCVDTHSRVLHTHKHINYRGTVRTITIVFFFLFWLANNISRNHEITGYTQSHTAP